MPEHPPSERRALASLKGVSAVSPASGLEAQPNLRDWLEVLRRHSRLAGGVTAAVMAVAAYVAYATPPEYRATSVVRLVNARRALAGGLVDAGADENIALPSANPVLSQVEVLRSRATAGAVVDDMPILRVRTRRFPAALVKDVHLATTANADSLQLAFGPQTVTVQGQTQQRQAAYGAPIEVHGIGFTIAEPPAHENGTLYIVPRDAVVGGMARSLLVKPRENTDVIDIAFTTSDPQRAQEVANRVARVFQAGNAQAARQEARRRREFIETQVRFNDSLLAEARGELAAFRGRAPSQAAGPGNGAGLRGRREELELERRQYAGLLGRLRDTSRVARRVALRDVIASSPSFGGNVVVSRLYEQLVYYETLRDSLTSGDWARTATNPDVQRLSPLIASTEANLVGTVQSVVASLDARIGVLDELQARSVATARQLSSTQATEDVLVEHVENARRVADQLRVEYQKARIAEAVQAGEVEIVDLAPLPVVPIGVGLARTLVFGLLLGLFLGGGAPCWRTISTGRCTGARTSSSSACRSSASCRMPRGARRTRPRRSSKRCVASGSTCCTPTAPPGL